MLDNARRPPDNATMPQVTPLDAARAAQLAAEFGLKPDEYARARLEVAKLGLQVEAERLSRRSGVFWAGDVPSRPGSATRGSIETGARNAD